MLVEENENSDVAQIPFVLTENKFLAEQVETDDDEANNEKYVWDKFVGHTDEDR